MQKVSRKLNLSRPATSKPGQGLEDLSASSQPRSAKSNGLLICFFLSGTAGLIYEIAWTKSLGLLFGHTVYANATVLAVFMTGIAAGSAWIGRKSEIAKRPIALYGWIELGVAVTGMASLVGLAGVAWLYYRAYPLLFQSSCLLLVFRFLGSALVLFVPTFLMGGTLPVLLRGLTPSPQRGTAQLGRRVSRLYWVNTLGGVIGAIMAGFILLPAVGLRFSIATAAMLNIGAGGVALWFSRRAELAPAISSVEPSRKSSSASLAEEGKPKSLSVGTLCAAFAVVGGTAISYEIAWARLLATPLGSSTYAFTLMLATFLLGITLGGILYERWSRRHQPSLTTFAQTQTFAVLAALLFLVSFHALPRLLPPILETTQGSFRGLLVGQFIVAALAMLPAAVLFGFNFPVVVALIADSPDEAKRPAAATGKAYAANTCGAILAAVLAGFFLIPWLGSFRSVAVTAAMNMFLAVALELFSSSRRPLTMLANFVMLACLIIVGWSPTFYDRALASFSTVLYWNLHPAPLTLQEAANTEDIVFLEDGLNATIAVSRSDDYVALKTNGKVDASSVDTNTQILLGELATVFHPNPRRVLVIGFGSGMTASAVSRFPEVAQIDCIEIEPAVLRAAPYLERLNRGVLRDPRLHLIVDDARNTLLTSRQQYDLIISEPSNPWIAGVATLFTDEFYAAVRKHLAPGGMFVQWVQGYSLEPSDLQMVLATIAPHFNDVTLWQNAGADFLILARTQSTPLDFSRARTLWSLPLLQADFATLRLARPESWPVYFRLDDSQLRALAAGGERNTDDHTLLEYRAPRAMVGENRRAALAALVERYRKDLLPVQLLPNEVPSALEASAESSLDLNLDRSTDYVHALSGESSTPPVETLRGRLALRESRTADAISHLGRAAALDPVNVKAIYWLALAKHSIPGDSEADALLTRVLLLDRKNLPALASRVAFARDRRDWRAGVQFQRELIAVLRDPKAIEFCTLGDLWVRAGNLSEAEEVLRAGLQRDPYSFLCNRELGEVDRLEGRFTQAREHLELVERMYPEMDPGTYASLALVYRSEKRSDLERAILAKGLRIFPKDPLISRITFHQQ